MTNLSAWRVEWLRLVRTRRLIALAGVFVLFGFIEPVATYYLPDLLRHTANGKLAISIPPPVPADGISGYASNALLIGLIVLVVVASSACAIDARPALSAFYRTRAASFWRLLCPRVAVVAGAGVAAYLLGLLAAWYETSVLIGAPDARALAESALLVALYLVFAVVATAAASTLARSTVATALSAISFVLAVNILAVVPQLTQWLPSLLSDAPDALLRHTATGSHYLKAVGVTVVASGALLLAAFWRGARRETV